VLSHGTRTDAIMETHKTAPVSY